MKKDPLPLAGADPRSAFVVFYASMSHGGGQAMQIIIRASKTIFMWRAIVHDVVMLVNEQLCGDRPKRTGTAKVAGILDHLTTIVRGVGWPMSRRRTCTYSSDAVHPLPDRNGSSHSAPEPGLVPTRGSAGAETQDRPRECWVFGPITVSFGGET